jgi:hypothetical protein
MAWSEKFESGANEKIVNVDTAKHRHEAALITQIEKALGTKFGGTWKVRANSYQASLSKNPNAVTLKDLGIK